METKKGCGQKDQNNRGHLGKGEPDCQLFHGSSLRILGGVLRYVSVGTTLCVATFPEG